MESGAGADVSVLGPAEVVASLTEVLRTLEKSLRSYFSMMASAVSRNLADAASSRSCASLLPFSSYAALACAAVCCWATAEPTGGSASEELRLGIALEWLAEM